MYGTFTIGGLGSNEQEEQKTIDLIYKLISENLLYDLQISINTPQPGTPFYLECKKNNYLITNNWNDFDGGNGSVVSYPGYTKKDIDSMYRKALDVYDKGLENRAFSLNFDKIIKTKIREIVKSDSKVVIIRSYRLWLINIILDSVNNKYKNSLICQNDVKNKFSVYDLEKIFCYGNGFINKKCFSSELIDKINSENFDYIIIPVRNVKINNFQNVMELIDELNINNILIIDSFGKVLLKR
jgi:hypothetical protein